MERNITVNELFNRSLLFRAIPLKGIRGKALFNIIMLQTDYGKAIDDFNERMSEGLKKLKEEKFPNFDDESGKPESERCAEYPNWEKELTALYSDMRVNEAETEISAPASKFTKEDFEALCDVGGADESIILPGGTPESPNMIAKAELLRMLVNLIEE